MIVVPIGLVAPAKAAGIPVPDDLKNFDQKKYVRWVIFLNMQLGRPMPTPTSHWHNAEIIAKLPEDVLYKVTYIQLEEDYGYA